MALTTSDMKRFAELGASLEIVTFVTEIVTRHEIVTKRDGIPLTPAERARRYREKHKSNPVTNRHKKVTEPKLVSPTPPSSPSLKSPVIAVNTKGFEEKKGLGIARDGDLFTTNTVTESNVTKRDEKTVTKKSNGGTIMPEDFFPAPNVWNDPEISNLTEHDKQIELQAMKDWSASRTGSKGKMLDWNRFARGWFRRHAKERKPRNGTSQGHHKPNSIADQFSEINAAIAERERELASHEGGDESSRDYIDHIP